MAMLSVVSLTVLRRLTDGSSAVGRSSVIALRCFSGGSGRVLSEEEQRARETVYIQKMEKERMEKKKKKEEEEKAKAERKKSEKAVFGAQILREEAWDLLASDEFIHKRTHQAGALTRDYRKPDLDRAHNSLEMNKEEETPNFTGTRIPNFTGTGIPNFTRTGTTNFTGKGTTNFRGTGTSNFTGTETPNFTGTDVV